MCPDAAASFYSPRYGIPVRHVIRTAVDQICIYYDSAPLEYNHTLDTMLPAARPLVAD
jgi:hypothetical protein